MAQRQILVVDFTRRPAIQLRKSFVDKRRMNTAISDDQFGLLVERQRPLKEYRELVLNCVD